MRSSTNQPHGTGRKFLRRTGLAATVAAVSLALGGLQSVSASDGGTSFKTFASSFSNLDTAREEVTLPLFTGTHNGSLVYYVVTDDSNEADAQARGFNYAPKLANALGTAAVQNARVINGAVDFPGTVDFSPTRVVVPGPAGNEFAGGTYVPGAVGDATYSPLITTGNGVVLDATQVANASGVHDSVVNLDIVHHTVRLKTFFGFWNGHKTVYLHLDATSPVVAAAEGSNFAPNLDFAPGLGSNEVKTSSRSAIIPIINGAVGASNPQRQGLNSALRGEGDPNNINQDIPGQGNGRYSPVWDIHAVVWTDAAIASGQRRILSSASDLINAFDHGLVFSAGNGPANPSLDGFKALGAISNCPLIALS